MKKSIAAMILCLALLLTGCQGKDYAIKIDHITVTENDYLRAMKEKKAAQLQYMNVTDSKEYWSTQSEDGKTLSDVMVETVQDELITKKLYILQFDKLKLSFTEEEESAIQSAISDTIRQFGVLSDLNEYLSSADYTYDEFENEFYDPLKQQKVLSYYFGADGKTPVDPQDIKDYYNVHNAYVKMIIISKLDDEGNLLEETKLKELAQKAEDAYVAATTLSTSDNFADSIAVYSDFPHDIEGMVLNRENISEEMEQYIDTLLDMKINEVVKLDTDTCHYIIKRYDGTTEDVFTSSMQLEVLKILRAEEIEALEQEWRDAAKIKFNKKLVKKYRPENMIQE